MDKPLHKYWLKNTSGTHLTVLMLIVLLLFAVAPVMWSGAAPAEALFFLELKEPVSSAYYFLIQKLFGFIAAYTGFYSLWPLRLFSALCALATVFCTYFCAKKLYNVNSGFFAALILITMPLFARFAAQALPYMWFAALISFIMLLQLNVNGYLAVRKSWWRLALLWLGAVLALLSFGLTALYIFAIFILGNFLLLKIKRQPFFYRQRVFLLLAIFAAAAVIAFAETFVQSANIWLSAEHTYVSFSGILRFKSVALAAIGHELLQSIGIWLLAVAVIFIWIIIRALRRKLTPPPHLSFIALWFLAALIPAVLAGYGDLGMFLPALPPLAVFIAGFLDRYAGYRNAQPRSRRILKANGITLKFLLTLWGAAICAAGVFLFFNLHEAWQRELYLQTRHLVFLIIIGAVIIVISIRAFWIVSRAYAYWGFIVAMLLSFSFIGNAVVIPSRDLLHTSYYFTQNLKALYPNIKMTGVTVGVSPGTAVADFHARYFLYADFPVHFVETGAAAFADDGGLLDALLVMPVAAADGAVYKAGYRPAYWEEVDGSLLVVFEKPALNVNGSGEITLAGANGLWPAGFCWAGGYLVPYKSEGPQQTASVRIITYPEHNLRIFSIKAVDGLHDPYIFRWLTVSGKNAPRGTFTGLALHYQTAYVDKHWPYGLSFQQWALARVNESLQPAFIVFTGLNPEHNRSRRVLNKILAADKLKRTVFQDATDMIVFKNADAAGFLQFYLNTQPKLALELKVRK